MVLIYLKAKRSKAYEYKWKDFTATKKEVLSQEGLAEKLNVTRQTVSNWELGQTTPDIQQAKNISKIFKISLDDLTDNKLEFELTKNSNNILQNLIGKECHY